MNANLTDMIIARADSDNLPDDHELRVAAKKFTKICKEYHDCKNDKVSIEQFIGTWARTRRLWTNYTGESLI